MNTMKKYLLNLLNIKKKMDKPIPNFSIKNKEVRELWLESTLAKIPAGSRILDAGAGELQYKKYCSHLQYVSQDFAQYSGTGDEKGLQTKTWDQTQLDIVCDIVDIPEPDASFDAIMCIEVFEHLPEPVAALRELTRLLKPGGYLVTTAPFNSLTHFSPYHYQTGFSEYFYTYWYEKFGLEILDLQKNGNYFEYLGQEIQRIPSMTNRFTKYTLSDADNKTIHDMMQLIYAINAEDDGSNEMLCFGIHVFARRCNS